MLAELPFLLLVCVVLKLVVGLVFIEKRIEGIRKIVVVDSKR